MTRMYMINKMWTDFFKNSEEPYVVCVEGIRGMHELKQIEREREKSFR